MGSGITGQKEVSFGIFRIGKDNLLFHNLDVMHIEKKKLTTYSTL